MKSMVEDRASLEEDRNTYVMYGLTSPSDGQIRNDPSHVFTLSASVFPPSAAGLGPR